ncbi:MAG: translational GTPase TypA [Chloroflexi bacterium]|nr:translational GTPase TypA [Chloroflexota bacterium]HCU72495.1 translational GTPase TypA [Chloroflexota bacterium]|tara:strand:+ start:12565 stop:14370 length:1806 start_codon:yes stop_codon:yes gene_type:complete
MHGPKDIRNLAIIAHVDHGKTTLVDAILKQCGSVGRRDAVEDRVMDSMDLEKEKGITILAKNASVISNGVKVNIVDTPGHADFGGEVERGLEMVDGALLLVDASEGPLPQTKFVLKKALEKGISIIVVINKVDRRDARTSEVVDEVYDLFFELGADEAQIEFPIVYCVATAGLASLEPGVVGEDLGPLFQVMQDYIPAPTYSGADYLQALVTNLDAAPHYGRLAICKVKEGYLSAGKNVAHCKRDGSVQMVKLSEVFITEGLERVRVETVGPGEICVVAGIPDVTIGETLSDVEDPRPLPLIQIDEPTMAMNIGINTSPMSGREGGKLTSRMLGNRLEAEMVGNVSIKVEQSQQSESWNVQGRGELQLAVLIETMRREGFELTVGKPEVLTKLVEGKLYEPMDELLLEVQQEFVGLVSESVAGRRGRMTGMNSQANGNVQLEFVAPVRGLLGFHTEFLSATRGTGVMNRMFSSYQPWLGEIRTRRTGSLIADRPGVSTTHALFGLQSRGRLFVPPGIQVYEGMVVGENARSEDLDVNPTREKKLSNMRTSGVSDSSENLTPHVKLSLEQALEFIRPDECLEVTPQSIRVRKAELNGHKRGR